MEDHAGNFLFSIPEANVFEARKLREQVRRKCLKLSTILLTPIDIAIFFIYHIYFLNVYYFGNNFILFGLSLLMLLFLLLFILLLYY